MPSGCARRARPSTFILANDGGRPIDTQTDIRTVLDAYCRCKRNAAVTDALRNAVRDALAVALTDANGCPDAIARTIADRHVATIFRADNSCG